MNTNLFNKKTVDWSIIPLKRTIAAIKGGVWGGEPDGTLDLSVIRVADLDRQGLRVRDIDYTIRSISLSERNGRLLAKGDLLIEKSGGGDQQLVGTVVSFDYDTEAVCSNFMAALKPNTLCNVRFLVYLHAYLYGSGVVFKCIKQTTGIQNIDLEDYFITKVLIPPLHEQNQIASFLDQEIARIDALIAAKENLLNLLAEKRRALITSAVTHGIDSTVRFKDSGIPWLGEIPEHWDTRRVAFLFRERDERNQPDLPLLTVSINTGVSLREFSDDRIEGMAADPASYKVARKGDVAFNKMRMWQGAVGVSPTDGLVSPDYVVADPTEPMDVEYFGLLFKTQLFSAETARQSHGITWDRLRLYWEDFRDIRVPLPPVAEQAEIVKAVQEQTAKLDALKIATDRTIALLRERRTALIAAAVTGKIDIPEATA